MNMVVKMRLCFSGSVIFYTVGSMQFISLLSFINNLQNVTEYSV